MENENINWNQNNTRRDILWMWIKFIGGMFIIIFFTLALLPYISQGRFNDLLIVFIIIFAFLWIWVGTSKDSVMIYTDGISKPLSTWKIMFKKTHEKIMYNQIKDFYIIKTIPDVFCFVELQNGETATYRMTYIKKSFFKVLVKTLKTNANNVEEPDKVKIKKVRYKKEYDLISLTEI